jgi:hypothetical protein
MSYIYRSSATSGAGGSYIDLLLEMQLQITMEP